jgi:hypothetical protein
MNVELQLGHIVLSSLLPLLSQSEEGVSMETGMGAGSGR